MTRAVMHMLARRGRGGKIGGRGVVAAQILAIATLIVALPFPAYAGTWSKVASGGFGDSNNKSIEQSPTIFNGYLYVGTRSNPNGAQVWTSPDGASWSPASAPGFGSATNTGIWPSVVFNGYLYAGTDNGATGGQVWRSANGTTWTKAAPDGFGDSNNDGSVLEPGALFNGYLYAGTWNGATGGEVWRSLNGTTWTQVNTDGFGTAQNVGVDPSVVFNGCLYAWTENAAGGEIWRTCNGTTWSQVASGGFGDPNNTLPITLVSFEGYLYSGTRNTVTGGEMWRSLDGTTWTQVGTDGFGDANNKAIYPYEIHDGYLYAVTGDAGNATTGSEVWRTPDGITWTQINADGFGNPSNLGSFSMRAFNGLLYAGTRNLAGGEVWAYAPYGGGLTDAGPGVAPVTVSPGDTVELTFADVTATGMTSVSRTTFNQPAPSGYSFLGNQYDINTTATATGPITVKIRYKDEDLLGAESGLKMLHWNGSVWEDVTLAVDAVNNTITGQTNSLSPFTLAQADAPVGTWSKAVGSGFGDANNIDLIRGKPILNGYLYSGSENFVSGGEIWRTSDGATWTQVSVDGFGDSNNRLVWPYTTFNGYVYAGVANPVTKGQIWRSTDGTTWSQVASGGFGDVNNEALVPLAEFNGSLYAGLWNSSTGVEIWRSGNGTAWTQVNGDGFGNAANVGGEPMVVFDGYLYVWTENGSGGGEIWRSSNGTFWTQVMSGGFGDPANAMVFLFTTYGGYLYAGTLKPGVGGGEVWRSADGTNWSQVGTNGLGDLNNKAVMPFAGGDGYLYAGTWNSVTGAEIWRTSDGITWTQISADGFGNPANTRSAVPRLFEGLLYAGTRNTATGGEIWVYAPHGGGFTDAGTTVAPVTVGSGNIVELTFNDVTADGMTSVIRTSPPEPPPSGFTFLGSHYDITTSATFTPPITVKMKYSDADVPAGMDESSIKMLHYDAGQWVDVTTSVDTVNNVVTGQVSHFSIVSLVGGSSLPSTGADYYRQALLGLVAGIVGLVLLGRARLKAAQLLGQGSHPAI